MSEIILHCPRCDDNKEPKLYVNVELGVFNCYRCNFKGKIKKLYRYPALISTLEDKISISEFVKLKSFKPLEVKDIDALEDLNPVRELYYQDPQYDYLINRGWTESLIDIYRPLVSLNPKYKDRVILPVIKDEKIIYFTARSIEDTPKMKYKNPSIPRKDIIFESKLPENKLFNDILVITEGFFDAFAIPNAIALFGKTIASENEQNVLKKAINKSAVYVALDEGAEEWMKTICKKLNSWMPNKKIYYINTSKYQGNDLGKMSETMTSFELINWIKENSIPYQVSSLIDILRSRINV